MNGTDFNTTTAEWTTTAAIEVNPLPPGVFDLQREITFCNTISVWAGLWLTGFLVASTAILVLVVRCLASVGAVHALPKLAGLRYNLFAALWLQGLTHFMQAFQADAGKGCRIAEPFLITVGVPMPLGTAEITGGLPSGLQFVAVFSDTMLAGYVGLMLLVALPRQRLRYLPDPGEREPQKPGIAKRCALPAVLLLLLLSPLVTALLLILDQTSASLWTEAFLFVLGILLCWRAGREERRQLAKYFDHLLLQEWIVIFAFLLLRLFKLGFHGRFTADGSGKFVLAVMSSWINLAVSAQLLVSTAPWKDPLLWLAGQDWLILKAEDDKQKGRKEKKRDIKRRRRRLIRFGLSMVNVLLTLSLVLRYDLEKLGIDVEGEEEDEDEDDDEEDEEEEDEEELQREMEKQSDDLRGRAACAEWAHWADKVASTWPGLERDQTGSSVTLAQVVPPSAMTRDELELYQAGKLTRLTRWAFVHADFFSDRMHSQEIAVLLLAQFVTNPSLVRLVTSQIPGLKIDIFLQSMIVCWCLWLWCGFFLMGNNVFMPLCGRSAHLGRRAWLTILLVWEAFYFQENLQILRRGARTGSYQEDWLGFALYDSPAFYFDGLPAVGLCFYSAKIWMSGMLISIILRLFCMEQGSQVRNTYHRLEFAAQRYTKKLLEGELKGIKRAGLDEITKDQIFQVKYAGGSRPCRLLGTNPDGTRVVRLQGGQTLQNVLLKNLEPLRSDERLMKEERTQLADLMSVLGPMLSSLKLKNIGQALAVVPEEAPKKEPEEPEGGLEVQVPAASSEVPAGLQESPSVPPEVPESGDKTPETERHSFAKLRQQTTTQLTGHLQRRQSLCAKAMERASTDVLEAAEALAKLAEQVPAKSFADKRSGETSTAASATTASASPSTSPSDSPSALQRLRQWLFAPRGEGAALAEADAEADAEAAGPGTEDLELRETSTLRNVRQSLNRETAGHQAIDDAIVAAACDAGIHIAQHVHRQRQYAGGFRIFFSSSVGMSSLMLLTLVVGPLFVVLATIHVTSKVNVFEHDLTRMRSAGVYALRVRRIGFGPGACGPMSHSEMETCRRQGKKGLCDEPAPMLMHAFDADRSGALEVSELDYMARVLAGISFSAAGGDSESIVMSRAEFRTLMEETASPGSDLEEHQLPSFLCSASVRLDRYAEQVNNVSQAGQGYGDLFAAADRSPRDGFLTQSELQSLVPAATLGRYPEALNAYNSAMRLGFMFADRDPTDGRLSPPEAATAVETINHLTSQLPVFLDQIASAQSGGQVDPAAIIQVLDVDGNGAVSRSEVALLASISQPSSPQVSGLLLSFFDRADANADGFLTAAELNTMLQQLDLLLAVMRTLISPNPSQQDVQRMLLLLDTNGDGGLSQGEMDRLVSLLPPQYSAQAPYISTLVFLQADTSPKDGVLTPNELEVAIQQLQALVQQVAEAPTANTPAAVRRLQLDSLRALSADEELGKPLTDGVTLEALERFLSFGWSVLLNDQQKSVMDEHIIAFLNVLNSDEFAIITPLVFLGIRLAILGAAASSLMMMLQTKLAHERTTNRVHGGDHNFPGGSQKENLRNAFSVATTFPGIFLATVVVNFAVSLVIIFIAIVIVVTPIVLLIIEGTRPAIMGLIWQLRIPILAVIVKYILKAVVVDMLLVEHGMPLRPYIFSFFWWMLIILNCVQAPFFAVYRCLMVIGGGFLTSTYLHVCAVPENLMFFDPGYTAFITMTYTQSTQRNLVRTCFISALMPQLQRSRSQPEPDDANTPEAAARHRRLRMRNKLWVAVTLSNNPELRKHRRISREREFDSLRELWETVEPEKKEVRPRPSKGSGESTVIGM